MKAISEYIVKTKFWAEEHFQKRDILLIILILTPLVESFYGDTLIQEKTTLIDTSSGLDGIECFCLYEDRFYNMIYIGTDAGIMGCEAFSHELVSFLNESHELAPSYIIDFAAVDSLGGFYGLSHNEWGGVYWTFGKWLPDEPPRLLNVTGTLSNPYRIFNSIAASDEYDILILGSGGNNLVLYDIVNSNSSLSNSSSFFNYGVEDIFCLDSLVLIGTGTGLCIMNLTTGEIDEYEFYVGNERVSVNCIEYNAMTNELYLGTSHGVYFYLLENNSLTLVSHINEADGILSSEITCLELDVTADRLYIGTKYGVSVYDMRLKENRKNYPSIFPSEFQRINDILMYRTGRYRELYVASSSGLAIIEVNNLPDVIKYVSDNYPIIITLLGIPTAILGIYVSGKKSLSWRGLTIFLLSLCIIIFTLWIMHLLNIGAIPNYVPPKENGIA